MYMYIDEGGCECLESRYLLADDHAWGGAGGG